MAAIAYVCKHLCTKSMYTAEERGSRALLEPSDTAVFWCNKTGGAMGPDQDIAGPRECGDGRSCYLAAPVLMTAAAE
jgi:hypothetical protein